MIMKAIFQWDLDLKPSHIINHQTSRQFKVPVMSRIILGAVTLLVPKLPYCLSQQKPSTDLFVCFVCVRACSISLFIGVLGTFEANSSSVLVSVQVVCRLRGQYKHLDRNVEYENEV